MLDAGISIFFCLCFAFALSVSRAAVPHYSARCPSCTSHAFVELTFLISPLRVLSNFRNAGAAIQALFRGIVSKAECLVDNVLCLRYHSTSGKRSMEARATKKAAW
ncbi:hypothetical protein P389DRAFT_19329 [Cystobasidium minutum MCA 4210]|uniref:uncharacterized protein n=1 Tax=Cystobasidium minutum MCA 4210 TaxID=1397322 RepID=UPI0034CDB946|eukprot:jgi/Rhomi1/19329/CE19328_636